MKYMYKSDIKELVNVFGLMFIWVGVIFVDQRLFFVLQEVFDVFYFMMDGDQIFYVNFSVYFYFE